MVRGSPSHEWSRAKACGDYAAVQRDLQRASRTVQAAQHKPYEVLAIGKVGAQRNALWGSGTVPREVGVLLVDQVSSAIT